MEWEWEYEWTMSSMKEMTSALAVCNGGLDGKERRRVEWWTCGVRREGFESRAGRKRGSLSDRLDLGVR
jgi:hypothetical protein